jgi:UDP-4-amino-4,6-dideoxy-N-acetyl-beta-L-altrosamine N-acetyltransferase
MKISQGVHFEKLSKDTLELLRNWRNQDFVLEQMEFQSVISKENQESWFAGIENSSTHEYYIFGTQSEQIGLVHLANIDTLKKSADVGLFIGNQNFIGTGIAFYASAFILNRAFEELNLDVLLAKVKKSNLVALKYNETLGFEFIENHSDSFVKYTLTHSNFVTKTSKLLKKLL